MARNIILCMDGTWNKPGQTDQGVQTATNVRKLYDTLADRPDQIRKYFPGVGTDPGEKVSGGAFGWGLFDQIKDGYRYLRECFEPGDRICIFGFSRGAYSARSLAGMVLRCGIARRDVQDVKLPGLVADLVTTQQDANLKVDVTDKAFAMYKHAYEEKNRADAEQFKRDYCNDTVVHLIGVWDTVGALGIPNEFFIPPLRKIDKAIDARLYGFLDTNLSPRVEAAYHALAIDEQRKPFLPTPWTDAAGAAPRVNVAGSKVEQVWFVGAHSNVGGGYADAGLSDIALNWMVNRTSANGLQFEPPALAALRPNPRAKRRDSLKEFAEIGSDKKNRFFAWIDRLSTRFLGVRRPILEGSWIHDSVAQRLAAPAVAEPESESAYSPAPTLKVTTRDGVRTVDPQFRLVS
ncbi:MAG: DUF2235 domain-containing protein [Betaproteobacteria bacterium]|nr:DUF2235 domain-containing protein [Betaproteobacteria bacterium]